MRNRASSHLLLILLILGLEIVGYMAVHRAGLLRGYETSTIGAVRDLMMFFPLMLLAIWRRVWTSKSGGHQHGRQDWNGAESCPRLRSKDWRAEDSTPRRA